MIRPRSDVVQRVVAREWGLDGGRLEKAYLGINSFTWLLGDTSGRFVVKWVFPVGNGPGEFAAGLEIADSLDGHGVRTAPPVHTAKGERAIPLRGGWLAVLRFETGHPLDPGNGSDAETWGRAVATCHGELAAWNGPTPLDRWPWSFLRVEDELHNEYPWLRATISPVIRRAEQWVGAHDPRMHWLHGDPNPQEFLLGHPSQPVAVLDWGGCLWGPSMYDLACAMFYADGPNRQFQGFLNGYTDLIRLHDSERNAIPVFCRLRWAVHALHFARRTHHGIALGGDRRRRTRKWYDGYNEYGLRVARQTLEAWT
jgi:homoserine kinase type II